MYNALNLEHADTGYRCADNSICANQAKQQCQPVSAFERFAALQASSRRGRNLALLVNFVPCTSEQPGFCAEYCSALQQEIAMLGKVVSNKAPIQHLHFTGHASQYQPELLSTVMRRLAAHFTLQNHNLYIYSINLDPYQMNWASMGAIRELGFNSVSLKADNEEFCFKQIQSIYEAARTLDFNSISITLEYDRPGQDCSTLASQLSHLISLGAERIRLLHQQQAEHSMTLFAQASQQLGAAGYSYIGMGCFALPDDAFVSACEAGLLSCNAMGQPTSNNFDILGFGLCASSLIGQLYYENCPSTTHYLRAIAAGQLPGALGGKAADSSS